MAGVGIFLARGAAAAYALSSAWAASAREAKACWWAPSRPSSRPRDFPLRLHCHLWMHPLRRNCCPYAPSRSSAFREIPGCPWIGGVDSRRRPIFGFSIMVPSRLRVCCCYWRRPIQYRIPDGQLMSPGPCAAGGAGPAPAMRTPADGLDCIRSGEAWALQNVLTFSSNAAIYFSEKQKCSRNYCNQIK